ncbi:hypothetical protein CDD81_3726 [Ophiocordyceps australis]|uniref:Wings apart-like protein C-terminal domain-containing protein n=1 Tax=Ophiocordyceps australis TaxID=1399860 RepID=A0A2C5XAL4_9HYPO|nr:hypothetical protein CDD81_3726 [Ophiocordyceps australis]
MSSRPPPMPQATGQKKLLTYGLVSRRKKQKQGLKPLTATTNTAKHNLTLSSASASPSQQQRPQTTNTSATPNTVLGDGEPRQKRPHAVAFPSSTPVSRRTPQIGKHERIAVNIVYRATSNSTRLSNRLTAITATYSQRTVTPESDDDDEPEFRDDTRPRGSPSSLPLRRPMVNSKDLRVRPVTLSNKKIKRTYSRSTSMLNERLEQSAAAVASVGVDDESTLSDSHALGSCSPVSSLADNGYGEPEDDDSQPIIKSVHELRRAGANNRFADELDDLLGRIGKPSKASLTMRRNALNELAHRLPNESFCRQFRDHASRDKIARDVGSEDDVICAFLISSTLIIFLASGPAPHLLRQLADEGLGKMLCRMLRYHDDIDIIASQRKTNLSRTSKASLHDVKQSLLRDISLWHGLSPTRLSPRTLSLRLLETVCRCADAQLLEHFACDLREHIVLVAAEGATETREVIDETEDEAAVDFALVVFSLELLSGTAATSTRHRQDKDSSSVPKLPHTVAALLQRTLHRWPAQRGELEATTLRLAINTTNGPDDAAAFHDSDILSLIASRICLGFHGVQDALNGGSKLQTDLYDELLLILGVMINIVEHSPSARMSVENTALDSLVKLWQANRLAAGEADSVEKSQISVAVGYLSVLLGYICLEGAIRARVDADGAVVQPLVASIHQFAAVCRSVGSRVHELESLLGQLEFCTARSVSLGS